MPRLPRVALREVEALGVRRQPRRRRSAGRGRARCRGGAASGRAARPSAGPDGGRRGPPARRRSGSALVISSAIPSRPRGALHAVEGARDVRPHALALALGERAVVAAAGRRRARPAARAPPRRRAAIGAERRAVAGPHLEDVAHRHADAHRRERGAVGERHAHAPRRRSHARRAPPPRGRARGTPPCRRGAAPGRLRSAKTGLEQPRVRVVHRPRAGERAEVGSPLGARLPPTPARDEREHQRAEHERDEPAHHEQRRLAGLGLATRRPRRAAVRLAGTFSRPQPASAAARAPGAASGPRTVERNVAIPQARRARARRAAGPRRRARRGRPGPDRRAARPWRRMRGPVIATTAGTSTAASARRASARSS